LFSCGPLRGGSSASNRQEPVVVAPLRCGSIFVWPAPRGQLRLRPPRIRRRGSASLRLYFRVARSAGEAPPQTAKNPSSWLRFAAALFSCGPLRGGSSASDRHASVVVAPLRCGSIFVWPAPRGKLRLKPPRTRRRGSASLRLYFRVARSAGAAPPQTATHPSSWLRFAAALFSCGPLRGGSSASNRQGPVVVAPLRCGSIFVWPAPRGKL